MSRVRQVLPGVPTTASQNEVLGFYLLTRFGLDSFAKPEWDVLAAPPKQFGWLPVIYQGLVDAAERHDRPVYAFTINEAAEAKRLVSLGVAGIITDRPDVVVAEVR